MASTNATILDAVRLAGTNDYQQRIPATTQGDITATVRALFDPMNGQYYNEFLDALVMRIGNQRIHNNQWTNILGNLKGDTLQYGNTVQEFVPSWIKAHSYAETHRESDIADYFATDLLNIYKPDGAAWYHSVNRQDKYPISINEEQLRRSFTDDQGLSQLVNSILQVPYNSDNYDEYRIMLQLTAEYMSRWGGYVDVLSASPTTEAGAKELLTKVRTYTGRLRFPSTIYSAAPIDAPVFVNPDELILLITPEYEAYLDVNVLASVFNVERADINVRRIVVDEFPVPNCVAMLMSQDWFVCHDKVYRTTSFYNPAELTNNYYLHHWGIYSCSPFMPCIYFMYGAGSATVTPTRTQTVTGIDSGVVDVTVTDGAATVPVSTESLTLYYELTGTSAGEPFALRPDSVTFDVATSYSNRDGRTYVRNSEINPNMTDSTLPSYDDAAYYELVIDGASEGDTVTVTATSTYVNPSGNSSTYTDEIEFTISDNII